MKEEDLKKDVVYQFTWGSDKRISIGTVWNDGSDSLKNYIYKEFQYTHEMNIGGGTMNNSIVNCKPATSKQIKWYNECKKLKNFIPFDEIKITNDYPIY